MFNFPGLPHSSSPSRFYTARVWLLFVVAPIGSILVGTLYLAVVLFLALLSLLVPLLILIAKLVTVAVGCFALYGVWWWMRNGRPAIPFAEIRRALAPILSSARAAVPLSQAEENGLIDVEAQDATGLSACKSNG